MAHKRDEVVGFLCAPRRWRRDGDSGDGWSDAGMLFKCSSSSSPFGPTTIGLWSGVEGWGGVGWG